MATKANISVDQGATFSTYVSLTDDNGNPLDLTAYSGIACMRTSYASVNAVPFQVSLANGNVTLALDANTTSNMTRPRYLYDLFLIDGSNTYTKVLEGVVYVTPSITHPNTGYTYYTWRYNPACRRHYYTSDFRSFSHRMPEYGKRF